MAKRQKVRKLVPCLIPPGDRPSQYSSPKNLLRWVLPHLEPHGYANDAKQISSQLAMVGFVVPADEVQRLLDLGKRTHRPIQAPPVTSTRPKGAPADSAHPSRIVRWLVADMGSTPTVADVYRRARIRGYDHITQGAIARWLPGITTGRHVDALWALRLLYLNPERYAARLVLLFGRVAMEAQQRQSRDVLWGIRLLHLDPTVYPLLLLVLVGRRLSDPAVDYEDAPEFYVGSEWVDPAMPRAPDGRTLFARVWTADGQGIRLAYLAVSATGNRTVDQGVLLTESMRERLQSRHKPVVRRTA